MGTYLNPGNSGFERILKGDYVDKTGLISIINKTIDTTINLTCISRPRRFGKSYAAQMLCAYYDNTCDSHKLFDASESFQNDVETFTCKDDVLTLLTHLGYLTYEEEPDSYDDDSVAGLVKIPNEEVRSEFDKILRKAKHKSLIELVKKSDQLLKDTIEGKNDAVAKDKALSI